jgi:hypothetical protein
MINPQKVNWEKLRNPSSSYKLFVPTQEKIDILARRLLNDYLYMADEERDPIIIQKYIDRYFSPYHPPLDISLFYELDNFDGFVGFTGIQPEYKCNVSFKIWNPKIWGPTLARENKELAKLIMNEFKLKRMSSASPDRDMVKFAKLAGFKQEGARRYGFKWNDKFFTYYLLGITKD